jgi:putative PEP-CTERM system histidine kinase
MILGLGSIFAIRIFTTSQVLLFHSIHSSIELLNSAILIIASMLIVFSLFRSGLLNIDIYLSETMLFRSFTVLIVGIYLLMVGILAKIVSYFNGHHPFFIEALFVFLAFLGLTVILLSNEVRQRIKRLVHLHFRRPHYDYRKEWMEFTQRTSSLLDMKRLCSAMVKMVSDTFGVSSVTIWLVDQAEEKLVQCGSTAFSEVQSQSLRIIREGSKEIIRFLKNQRMPVDVDRSEVDLGMNRDFLHEAKIKYCMPLFTGNEFLGIMTLNNRLTDEEFSIEDLDLLKTIADQAAASILNLKMTERIKQAKEMETIQTMSSFFVHDLKNLASKLSMTMQNLPIHFDNPDFREDALRAISDSVNKIDTMSNGLSLLRQEIILRPTEVDFNEVIASTISGLNGCKASIKQELSPLPEFPVDPEQIQKVLTNLVLNANEAIMTDGEIRVSTGQRDGWVVVSVSDNGCGMSKEFMERSLFRPFKTTKKQGMGIGLFQSKMIVEAHQGRIEVESEEGRGSTFKVLLPLAGK